MNLRHLVTAFLGASLATVFATTAIHAQATTEESAPKLTDQGCADWIYNFTVDAYVCSFLDDYVAPHQASVAARTIETLEARIVELEARLNALEQSR